MSYKRKQRGTIKPEVVFPIAENMADMPNLYIPFFKQLKEINYDAGTFRERMKSGTSLTPDI